MLTEALLYQRLQASSFLEYAFLRWVLTPAVMPAFAKRVTAQRKADIAGRSYLIDYEIAGDSRVFAVELDGFEFHGSRDAFSYDRMRQNDLQSSGRLVIRFSYDSIRLETARCVEQLQAVLRLDQSLIRFIVKDPNVEKPEMDPDPLCAFASPPERSPGMTSSATYFDLARLSINTRTLRECQTQAYAALGNYYGSGGGNAATVMSVGAGKTALGVLACLAFTRKRALVVTPGSVIRGTFDQAFDHEAPRNVLYGLPAGPLIPGCRPPKVLTLDSDERPIRQVSREELQATDIIVTNFHSLGTGEDQDDLLSKLQPDDVDFIVVDEAHIAAAVSYQRTFRHFSQARTLLMSACFQRLDGKPIDADIVYRYRLIDSIADGNAKNLRVHRFEPDPAQTTYEMVWPDGRREEIVGRDAIAAMLSDERKLARVTARSNEPIRQVMRAVKAALERQTELLYPIKPRVLFSALGERHAEQISQIAEEHGIPCAHLHHSMSETRIRSIRQRFERESGDLQGIVQLKMLGQGYDFPPICIVVPMRPYGSFSEFYQFTGRGIRVLSHPALEGRVGPGEQLLDIIYHAELGLDEHIETICLENDMDPHGVHDQDEAQLPKSPPEFAGTTGRVVAEHPETFVLFEHGGIEQRIVHDEQRVAQRRSEREREALAQRYASYAQTSANPVSFEQFVDVMRRLSE